MGNGSGCAGGGLVDNITDATVCVEIAIHGKVDVDYRAVLREDFLNVFLFNVLCEFFNDNLVMDTNNVMIQLAFKNTLLP